MSRETINKKLAEVYNTPYYTPEEMVEAAEGMFWCEEFVDYYESAGVCIEKLNEFPIDKITIDYWESRVVVEVDLLGKKAVSQQQSLSNSLAHALYTVVTEVEEFNGDKKQTF